MTAIEDKSRQQNTPLVQFSLKITPGQEGEFEAWRQTIAPMFELTLPHSTRAVDYYLNTVGYYFSEISLSKSICAATIFDRNSRVIAQSGLDWVTIMTYTKGSYTLTINGETRRIEPGDFVVFDMSHPFRIEAQDYENLSVNIPRRPLEALLPKIDMAHGLVIDTTSAFNSMLLSHFSMLMNHANDFSSKDGPGLEQVTLNLIAASIGSTLENKYPLLATSDFSTLQKLRRAIEQQLENPKLSVKTLTLEQGISRSAIYRLFEPLEGVQNYIQRRRLARIYQAITDPANDKMKIGNIAARYGFSNATNFSRAFRTAYGLSPSEARKRAMDGANVTRPISSYDQINRWILGLENPVP